MTKTKSTKRALLTSALALLMCVSMLIGSTFAWFTDSVTSGNNKIVAGTLDVELHMWDGDSYEDISATSAPIFGEGSVAQNNNAETLWEPGKTQVAYLKIVNKGNLALKYTVGLNVQNVSQDLYEVMQYAITPNVQNGIGVSTWDDAAAKTVVLGTQIVTDAAVTMAPGAEHYFALSIHMDEEAGNKYQGGEVNFDLTVLATQATVEHDSFNDQYDADAFYPEAVVGTTQYKTLAEAIAAANASQEDVTISLQKDVAITDTVKINNANATITIEGNGYALTPATTFANSKIALNVSSTTVLNNVNFEGFNSTNSLILAYKGADITINGGSFNNNTGRDIITFQSGYGNKVVIDSVDFMNNTDTAGRGIVYTGSSPNATFAITNCTFDKNDSTGSSIIVVGGKEITFTGNTFTNNIVTTNGNYVAGGIYTWCTNAVISNNTFSNNNVKITGTGKAVTAIMATGTGTVSVSANVDSGSVLERRTDADSQYVVVENAYVTYFNKAFSN